MKKASKRYEKKLTLGMSIYEAEKEFWEVGEKLQQISFFSRYSVQQLENEVIPKLEVKDFQEDEVMFIQAEEVAIVIQGALLMRSHQESITTPQLVSKFGKINSISVAGDVIGSNELEDGISRSHQNWFTVHREAKIAFVSPENFTKIWSLQKKTEKELFKSLISTHEFFQPLSTQTIYLLSYELLEVRKYCPGDLVALMSKASPYNIHFQELFVNQISQISLNLKRQERKRLKIDRDSPELNMTLTSQTHFSARSGKNSYIKTSTQQSQPMGRTFKGAQKMSIISINDGKGLEFKEPKFKGRITEYADQESVDQSPKSRSRVKHQFMSNKSLLSGSTSFNGSGVELQGDIQGLDLIAEEEEYQFEKGLFIVNKGRAVVRDPYDGFEVAQLRRGEFFKEEEYLQVNGFCHFGNVFAEEGDEVLECLYISGVNLKRIPIWELEKLREFAENRSSIEKIRYTCELRASKRKK